MKKILLVNLLIVLSVVITYADGTITARQNCWGSIRPKYIATARVSAMYTNTYPSGFAWPTGQYVGTSPIGKWSTKCTQEKKGCNKQSAYCFSSGTVSNNTCNPFCAATSYSAYSGEANVYWDNGKQVFKYKASGRGTAGNVGDFILDSSRLANLNDNGSSYGDITGKLEINSSNRLEIAGFSGELSIRKNTDFYSKFKVLIVVEDSTISEESALLQQSLADEGQYLNVVDSSEILVKNGEFIISGFLETANSTAIEQLVSNEKYGVKIKDLSFNHNINYELKKNETFTLITIIDGGFDISSAIINSQPRISQKAKHSMLSVNVYPSVTTSTLNIAIQGNLEINHVQVYVTNLLGQRILNLENGIFEGKKIQLDNQDISLLDAGCYIVQILINDELVSKKIIVQ